MTGRFCRQKSVSQVCQQRPQLAFRFLVLLFDGEAQRIFQHRPGFGLAAKLEQKFPEQDSRHHPVGFLPRAEFEVWHGFRAAALRCQRLGNRRR